MPRSGAAFLKATLLVGALVITPLAIITTRISQTSAAPSKNVCILAVWQADESISSYHGTCPGIPGAIPGSLPTESASPSPSPTSSSVDPSASATPTATSTVNPSPTVSSIPSTDPTISSSPTPTATSTPSPDSSESPSKSPTPTASPTVSPSSQPTVSQSPTASPVPSPTPTEEPIPAIPPENTDPKTKEFRFCHNGSPMSNSYTGMMNGHHGNHPEDIIPPIPFKFYGGWNWNAKNAKAFYNNCVPVG